MADLFTHLAQGKSDGETVQPRLKTRFEDAAVEFAEDGPEAQTATDAATALPPESARARRERVEPAGVQANPTLAGMRTIREMTPGLDRQTTTRADRAAAPPEVAVNIMPPAQTKVETVTAIAHQPSATASKPIDERGGIVPRDQGPALPAASQRAVSSGEVSPIQPARPLMESIPASTSQAPVIEVHIGRIELRQAAPPVQAPPPARPRFEPALSLSDYLARRNGRGP